MITLISAASLLLCSVRSQVPNIDLIFIGTSDLSYSITGIKTASETPPVQAAIAKVFIQS